jgi:S-(hydroxymethyl)glutathione dehydrogenase/alcohol dehydrogenase
MRQALECTPQAAGAAASSSAWPRPARRSATRPFQLVTGRKWKARPSAAPSGRTDVPKIVDWYMDGKIEIDPMITHTMPLEEINKAFDLMHAVRALSRASLTIWRPSRYPAATAALRASIGTPPPRPEPG